MRILFVLLVFVLIGGCIGNAPEETMNILRTSTTIQQTTTTIPQTTVISSTPQELAECEKIQGYHEKDKCYMDLARSLNDLSICEKIQNELDTDGCYESIGVALNDLSICDKIQRQDVENWCYYEIAIKRTDLSICDDKIQDLSLKDLCYSSIGTILNDSSICNKIQSGQETKDYCYEYVGMALNDLSLCERIQRQYNKDGCYRSVGVALNDLSICEKIQNPDIKNWCNAVIRKDASLCNEIQNEPEIYKLACCREVGILLNDSSVCEKAKGQNATISTGFNKITPQLAKIRLTSDGTFIGAFRNGVGTNIVIDGVKIADKANEQIKCKKYLKMNVSTGDIFNITIGGCGKREVGNRYTIRVEIDYNMTIASLRVSRTESGTIIGHVE